MGTKSNWFSISFLRSEITKLTSRIAETNEKIKAIENDKELVSLSEEAMEQILTDAAP